MIGPNRYEVKENETQFIQIWACLLIRLDYQSTDHNIDVDVNEAVEVHADGSDPEGSS